MSLTPTASLDSTVADHDELSRAYLRSAATGRILRLEIENFKSYKGVHVVGPLGKLTGIVGPNGSGKSNLMNAVAFVLGVQSRDLRAGQVRDLIFRLEEEMQDGKAPRGAAVRLFFEKTAGEILEFERRISPTGSTTFFVNNKHVTAEDYNQHLSDLRILVRARNFLVFQGDVERMARRTPKELSSLFEQISGSEMYREAYDDSKTSLERQAADLRNQSVHRTHLESRRRELALQVEEVTEWNATNEKKKDLTRDQSLFKLHCLEVEADAVGQEEDNLRNKLNESTKERENAAQRLREADVRFVAKSKEVAKLDKSGAEVKKQATTLSESLDSLSEELRFLQDEKRRITKEAESLHLQQTRCQSHRDEVSEELGTAKEQLNEVNELGDVSLPSGCKMTKKQQKEYDIQKESSAKATASERVHAGRLQREKESKQRKLAALGKEIDDRSKVGATLQQQKDASEQSWEKYQADLEKLAVSFTEEKSAFDRLYGLQTESESRRRELLSRKDEFADKLRRMQSQRTDTKRQAEMRAVVNEMRKDIPGIWSSLSALCRPTTRKYNDAVAAGLGRYAEFVVVKNFQTAKAGIAFLKERGHRALTFLPLDNVTPPPIDPNMRLLQSPTPGGTAPKPLIDCIAYDREVEPAFLLALKNTVLVESMGDARKLAFGGTKSRGKGHQRAYKYVTLDGEKILSNGNLSVDTQAGHVAASFAGTEVNELEDALARVDAELCALGPPISAEQRLLAEEGLRNLETQIALTQQRLELWNSAKETKSQKCKETDDHLQRLHKDSAVLAAAVEKMEKEIETHDKQILQKEGKFFSKLSEELQVEDICALEAEWTKAKEERELQKTQLTKKLHRLKCDLEKSERQLEGVTAKVSEMRTDTLTDKIKAKLRSITSAKSKLKAAEEKAAESEEQLKASEFHRKEADTEVATHKKSHRALVDAVDRLQEEVNRQERKMKDLEGRLFDVLRDCVIEDIELPFLEGSMTAVKELLGFLGNEGATPPAVSDIRPNCEILPARIRANSRSSKSIEQQLAKFAEEILRVVETLKSKKPNFKSEEKWKEIDQECHKTDGEIKTMVQERRRAEKKFKQLRNERSEKFLSCFHHVQAAVDAIYHRMTCLDDGRAFDNQDGSDLRHPWLAEGEDPQEAETEFETVGGQAFLELEGPEGDEPFSLGVKYHTMPPSKRFRDMNQLSGGEQTMAALALLFAFQSVQPAPFVVLDEVDAALDPRNVQSLARYLRSVPFQVLVISLKDRLYSQMDSLVGVYKDLPKETSALLHFSLLPYRQRQRAASVRAYQQKGLSTEGDTGSTNELTPATRTNTPQRKERRLSQRAAVADDDERMTPLVK